MVKNVKTVTISIPALLAKSDSEEFQDIIFGYIRYFLRMCNFFLNLGLFVLNFSHTDTFDTIKFFPTKKIACINLSFAL